MKVAFFIRRIGPYHHARFKAAAEKVNLSVIETRPGSQEYPWEFDHDEHPYESYTLGVSDDPEKGFTGKVLKQKINECLLRIKPDVMVTTGWADQEYHAAVLWAIGNNIPRIVVSDSTENDVKRNAILEWIKKQILKNYQSAIVAGSRSRNYLIQLGFDNDTIFQPWDVVDNEYFSKAVKEMGDQPISTHPYFLCVSRFIPKKNISGLINAFYQFKKEMDTAYQLVLLGSGELESEIKELIDKLKLNDHVLLPGFKQLEGLSGYYKNTEALILPSYSDQWGLVVNEAMASGLPVLVSQNCGCVDDIVRDGKNGFVFNPYAIEDIKKTLIKFSQLSKSEKKRMGKKSKAKIKNYRIEDFAASLENAARKAMEMGAQGFSLSVLILKGLLLLRKMS